MYNCVDLSLLARTVDNNRWKGKYNSSLGLARLVEIYEYRLLPKDKITRSNWEAALSPNQVECQYIFIKYTPLIDSLNSDQTSIDASNDAHAGYILYRKLESMISSLTSPPNSIWYTFSFVSGYFVDVEGFHWQANNPTYDPGPLPPPRPPRESKHTNGTETPLQEGEDVSVVAKHVPNSKRKYGGMLPQGTRERQSDQLNTPPQDSGAGSVGSVSQSHANGRPNHYLGRQRRPHRKNLPSSPVQDSGSQVPHQRLGPNIHRQRTQHHNAPRHLPSVGSSAQIRLQDPDGTYIHLPRSQHQTAIPRHPHPPPSQTISPQLQANSAFRAMPSSNVPLSRGLPSDTPHVPIPQVHSGPLYVNPFPNPHANPPRSRARRFRSDKNKP